LALLTIVHRDNLLMLDRILMRLILLDCVRDLLLLLMMLLALLLRGHPLKLDLHPAVVHDHPSAWGTSTSTLLVVSGANLMHPHSPSGIAPLAAASTTDDWTTD
jgi:hypothetical protein